MRRNDKPIYIVIICILVMYLTVWWLNSDKPVEVDAGQAAVESSAETAALENSEDAATVDVPEMTQEELEEEMYYDSLEMLAVCVEAEAGNQGEAGKRLVTDVILNRVDDRSGAWEDTIEGVITQNGQFSSYWDGGMERVREPTEETYEAVRFELNQRSFPGIYYFREGTWAKYGTPWKKVGAHYFSGK